jgi:hypothetical protein
MANTFEMRGQIKGLFEPMTFASGFTKREFLVTMEDDNPLLSFMGVSGNKATGSSFYATKIF